MITSGCHGDIWGVCFDFFNKNGVSDNRNKTNPGQSIELHSSVNYVRTGPLLLKNCRNTDVAPSTPALPHSAKRRNRHRNDCPEESQHSDSCPYKHLLIQWRERLEQYLDVDFEPKRGSQSRGRRKIQRIRGVVVNRKLSQTAKLTLPFCNLAYPIMRLSHFVETTVWWLSMNVTMLGGKVFERVLKRSKCQVGVWTGRHTNTKRWSTVDNLHAM